VTPSAEEVQGPRAPSLLDAIPPVVVLIISAACASLIAFKNGVSAVVLPRRFTRFALTSGSR
jgi:hypothetical protein